MSKKTEKSLRCILITLCELLTIYTIIKLFYERQLSKLLLAFVTLLLILFPELVEKILHCHISQPLYLFSLFYAIGPMLGHCNNFYHLLPWWDKMLHVMGGIMFALFGMYFYSRLGGDSRKRFLGCCFSLCFSVTISVIWEFFEFGMDQFFAFDMQDDFIINSITSYALGSGIGHTGTIENISSVIIDSKPLPFSGYLDIGLVDTMLDMLLESLGAVVTVIWISIDKGKHKLIQTVN